MSRPGRTPARPPHCGAGTTQRHRKTKGSQAPRRGTKLGITQVFDDDGRMVPVTVVAAGPCVVTTVRTPDADGYAAVQLGYGEVDPRRVNKPEAGHFVRAGVTPRRYLVELRTDDASDYTLGQEVTAGAFEPGRLPPPTARSHSNGLPRPTHPHPFPP